MNATNNPPSASNASCLRSVLPDASDAEVVADYFFSVLAIVLNLLTCPPTILLNALILIAVRTKRRLQTNYNILLASLAGTDFAVGIVSQPAFIIKEIYRLTGGSPDVYCMMYIPTKVVTTNLCLLSLFHLVLISVERFVAMKYSLRYESIVNRFRLIVALSISWLIVIVYFLTMIVPDLQAFPPAIFAIVSLLIIPYCHISVYFVCRRHMNQIKSEQVSPEARAKFLAERKAWKTTSFIIGGVLMCYLPGILRSLIANSFHPLSFSCFMLNSLLNPIIYCWRSKEIREALQQLLRKQSN